MDLTMHWKRGGKIIDDDCGGSKREGRPNAAGHRADPKEPKNRPALTGKGENRRRATGLEAQVPGHDLQGGSKAAPLLCHSREDGKGLFKTSDHVLLGACKNPVANKLLKEGKRKVIAVDFDGVLAEDAWPDIGAPRWEVITALKILRTEYDARLILWTCRTGEKLKEALDFCKKVYLPLDAVNQNLQEQIERYGGDCRKVFAHIYLDDRALNTEEENTGWIIDRLRDLREDRKSFLKGDDGDEIYLLDIKALEAAIKILEGEG